ncbi:hypothetical protein Chor_003401 [Crotalus horridus]
MVCTEKGWEPTPPRCVAFVCHPPFFENGTIDPREDVFQHKMVVHFNCDTGFARVGPESAQCYHFGWSPLPPVCKENVKSCQALPRISHGMVAGERKAVYHHGDLLEVQCDISFALHGSKIIECVDGEWAALPSCIVNPRSCARVQHADFEPGNLFKTNQFAIYRCGSNLHQTKCVDGSWFPKPQCKETCPPPPQLPNAINIAEMRIYRSEEEISLKCRDNFILHGPPKIKCEDGKW